MDTVYYRRQLLAAPVFTATLIALVQLVTLSLHPRFFPVPPVARPSNAERSRKRVPPPRPLSRAEAASIRRKFDSDCDAIGNELSRREFSSAWKKKMSGRRRACRGQIRGSDVAGARIESAKFIGRISSLPTLSLLFSPPD